MKEKTQTRLPAVLLIAITMAAYALSYHPSAYDNENSRLDLAYSIALRGTLNIDAYHHNTTDKAFYGVQILAKEVLLCK